jgi:S-adenosylmethionine/arginine decarboxylase-like enzyme
MRDSLSEPRKATRGAAAYSHLIADLVGVTPPALRDAGTLGGLLIAAAGAAGFTAIGAPVVKQLPSDDVAAVLLLDGCHIALHAFPQRELLLLDVLAHQAGDAKKALDVFARRLGPREIRSEVRARG